MLRSATATTISDATICAASQAPRKVAAAVGASIGRGAADGRNPPDNEALPRAESTTVRPYLASGSDGHQAVVTVRRNPVSSDSNESVMTEASILEAPARWYRQALGMASTEVVRVGISFGAQMVEPDLRPSVVVAQRHLRTFRASRARAQPSERPRPIRPVHGRNGRAPTPPEGGYTVRCEHDASTTWHRLTTRLALSR